MCRKIFLALCLLSCTLQAHKLNLFLYDDEGMLYIQSYFTKSSPCKNCEIIVKDESGAQLAQLTTDENGKASLNAVESKIIVSVDGGMGHFQEVSYTPKSNTKAASASLPDDIPLWKMALSLGILAFIFGVSLYIKKRK